MRRPAHAAAAAGALAVLLAACSGAPTKQAPPAAPAASAPTAPAPKRSPYAPAQEDPSKRGDYVAGGLYKPGVPDSTPEHVPDVDAIPEPEVKAEPRSRAGNRSTYTVLGKTYRVLDSTEGFVEQGIASYYGQKFHGRRTSNLEVYDMYAFTAAHKSLPLPSFVRVTNLDNGKSVVVRVNDRGPFHAGRVIDLSYAAAVKLDITRRGTGRVEVRALQPGDNPTIFAGTTPKPGVVKSTLDRLVAAIPLRRGRKDAGTADAPVTAAEATAASASTGTVASGVATAPPVITAPLLASASVAPPLDTSATPAATGATITPPAATPTVAMALPATGPDPAVAPPAAGPIVLQVASFSTHDNATRALARLQDAGIEAARLHDGLSNGRKVWRLRVGPLAAAGETELAARIVGLGFNPPQRVHD